MRTSKRSAWRRSLVLALASLAIALPVIAGVIPARAHSREVLVADLDGEIDPVSARFVKRAIKAAARDGAVIVVIRLNTPGGLLDSTRDIVGDILDSPLPVVVYVSPQGARAASAGTFITAAADVAAMAPTTNVGAATPVGTSGEDLPDTLSTKAREDAAAFMRSIADRRGRNADALEAAVLEAKAYSAEEALDLGIVDLIAPDLDSLLAQLDQRVVQMPQGRIVLDTQLPVVREIKQNVVERALGFLGNPNVAFLFMSLGGLLILIEFWTPGTFGPAIVGTVFLLLGFTGLAVLPFSWTGVVLILLAMLFFFIESQVPGFGVFGITGIVSLILGGIFLVGFFGAPGLPAGPQIRVSPWTLAGVGMGAGVVVLWFVRELRSSRKLPKYQSPYSSAALVGKTARVTRALTPEGEVRVAGEYWAARLLGEARAGVGADVIVKGVDGLVLTVEAQPPAAGERSESLS